MIIKQFKKKHFLNSLVHPGKTLCSLRKRIHAKCLNPYTVQKRKTIFYKLLFLFWGVLFALLAWWIDSSGINWSSAYLFGSTTTMKEFVTLLCLPLSGASLIIGCYLTPEREALFHIAQQAKKRLRNEQLKNEAFPYAQKWVEVQEACEESKKIFIEIRKDYSLHCKQERLFNQQLLELNRKISEI